MRQQLVYRSQANILRNARQFGSKSRTPIFAQFSSKSMCWILHISSILSLAILGEALSVHHSINLIPSRSADI